MTRASVLQLERGDVLALGVRREGDHVVLSVWDDDNRPLIQAILNPVECHALLDAVLNEMSQEKGGVEVVYRLM